MKSFKSEGVLRYSNEGGYRLVAEVDQGIADYYRSLIPSYLQVQKPRWPAHCTIVRPGKEFPKRLDYWGSYDGDIVVFNYDPFVQIDETYYWLNAWCDRFVEIRTELGLPPKSRWTLPPSGGFQCFHVTIANKKSRRAP